MPNANVSIYFTDENFLKYLKKKEEINDKAREFVKKLVEEIK